MATYLKVFDIRLLLSEAGQSTDLVILFLCSACFRALICLRCCKCCIEHSVRCLKVCKYLQPGPQPAPVDQLVGLVCFVPNHRAPAHSLHPNPKTPAHTFNPKPLNPEPGDPKALNP